MTKLCPIHGTPSEMLKRTWFFRYTGWRDTGTCQGNDPGDAQRVIIGHPLNRVGHIRGEVPVPGE